MDLTLRRLSLHLSRVLEVSTHRTSTALAMGRRLRRRDSRARVLLDRLTDRVADDHSGVILFSPFFVPIVNVVGSGDTLTIQATIELC